MADSLQFNLDVIRSATENFSDSNKLGQGGFGPVFQGKLSSGQEIAVKRLSEHSGQGELELKNEVLLLVRLQHRNLVRLLGYCFEGVERLLVYEFVPNTSLDKFIFDPLKRALLDWDCRLFDLDQTRADTSKVAGTHGYMAPEYVMHGHFSQKTDVFSFGILTLEIVSGRRNFACQGEEDFNILTSDVWMNWREGKISNIVDPLMNSGYGADIVRCIPKLWSKKSHVSAFAMTYLDVKELTLPKCRP
ncbi:hypothetical protein MLD38_009994 [Melastoma candidum]|uniref:Uncharacterized protein n=1 Tax=Melastoma candidum TaxID=119954 RepID=A0ACB9QYB5_9MYRT|nr:hypothetical protein MLD38_009994 [Melastoma candidum]